MPSISFVDPGQPVAPISVQKDYLRVGALRINYADMQSDSEAVIEVRSVDDNFVIGGTQGAYVAIVRIPPKQYVDTPSQDDQGNPSTTRTAVPLDHRAVTIQLWPYSEE